MASSPVAGGYVPQRRVSLDVVGPAWVLFQAEIATWVLAFVAVVVVNIALHFTLGLALTSIAPFVGSILAQIPGQILLVGLLRMAFKQIRGGKIEIGDAFAFSDIVVPAAVATILTSLGVMIGAVFCIVPGLVLGALWLFTFPLVADRRIDGVEAMRTSWNALKDEWLMALVFLLVLAVMMAVGLALCGVGVLVTGPVALLSLALLYRGYFPEAEPAPAPAPTA
jgi:uncharacterized membrane protein